MTSDTWQRRRRLREIHDQLRDRGLNPLEAVPLAIQEVVDGRVSRTRGVAEYR